MRTGQRETYQRDEDRLNRRTRGLMHRRWRRIEDSPDGIVFTPDQLARLEARQAPPGISTTSPAWPPPTDTEALVDRFQSPGIESGSLTYV